MIKSLTLHGARGESRAGVGLKGIKKKFLDKEREIEEDFLLRADGKLHNGQHEHRNH